MEWFRWWHGTVTDPKFQWVARKSGQPVGNVIAVWAALLECASNATQGNADATRGNVASLHPEDFDILFGFEDGAVASIVAAMTQKGLIVDDVIAKWEERQPKREDAGNPNTGALSSTERARLRRERLRQEATKSTEVQRDATDCNAVQRDATTEEIREEKNKEVKAVVALPDFVPAVAWAGFVEMRKKIKKPMTDRAVELMFSKLDRLAKAGHSVGDCLERSTLNCWQDVFEPKPDQFKANGTHQPNQFRGVK